MGDAPMPFGARCKALCTVHWRGWLLFLTPLVLLPILIIQKPKESRFFYLICLMSIWFVTDCTKHFSTGWLPIIALPIMGILDSSNSCASYFNDATIVFFSGYVIALSLLNSKIMHRSFYGLVRCVGSTPRKVHIVLVSYTMFFSMWLPNSAASAIFCQLAQSVLDDMAAKGVVKLTKDKPVDNEEDAPHPSNIAIAFHMSVAYAATIGGYGTLIGSVTTLATKFVYYDRFYGAPKEFEFLNWLVIGIPLMLILTIIMCLYMQLVFIKSSEINAANYKFEANPEEMGTFSTHELQVLIAIIAFLALMISFRPTHNGGWGDQFKEKKLLESVPISTVMLLLFIIPINYVFFKYCVCKRPEPERALPSLIQWKFFNSLFPWDMLIIVGSAFSMYEGGKKIQFFKAAANCMDHIFHGMPPLLLQLFTILTGVFFTTFGANVYYCCLLVPMLFELALMIDLHPMYLALPASLACSVAFCLRVSTRPNYNAYDYCKYRNRYMFLCGLLLTVVAIVVIWATCAALGSVPFKNIGDNLDKHEWVWITKPPKTTEGPTTTAAPATPAVPAAVPPKVF